MKANSFDMERGDGEWKQLFKTSLLSQTNVDYVVKMVLADYKISRKAVDKCASFIKSKLEFYFSNLDRYPSSKEEIGQAISFLNKKCYSDFEGYLAEKYPGMDLKRSPVAHITPSPKMIIINDTQASELLKTTTSNNINTEFLQYLANPSVIQTLGVMLSQVNKLSHANHQKIDAVLSEEQAQALMSKTVVESSETTVVNQSVVKEPQKERSAMSIPHLDVSNMSNDVLVKVKDVMAELSSLKEKYTLEKKDDVVGLIDAEQKKILTAVSDYKTKMDKTIVDAAMKMETMTVTKTMSDKFDDLDLTIDPTSNYEDLKDITIKFNAGNKKISEVILVSYNVPYNDNNITRFNNNFLISYNSNTIRYFIPPGNYSVESIIQYIESKVPFLSFSIYNNVVKIVNKNDLCFDLDINNDSVFTLLGFVGNAGDYKDEKEYTAAKPYDIDCQKSVFFSLHGTNLDPIELKFDEDVTPNKLIRSFKGKGGNCSHIRLSLMNRLGQCYDFDKPLKMFLRLNWAS